MTDAELATALRYALEHGVSFYIPLNKEDGEYSDQGCGCCSHNITEDIPKNIRAIFDEVMNNDL